VKRERRRWSAGRKALWLAGAFAAGSIPTCRIVTRMLTGKSLDELGDGKPGSANVGRSVGWRAGAGVLALDAGKAYLPATLARLTGAGEDMVAMMGITTMTAHITVVGGRGAACALGAAFAMDAPTMAIDLVPLLGGMALDRNSQAVAVTAFALPPLRWGLRRRLRPGLWTLVLIGVLFAARLRGTKGVTRPRDVGGWWRRFWLDRDD
jgi:acyl phosphate:glycerol-3-phosphate acyltransferase